MWKAHHLASSSHQQGAVPRRQHVVKVEPHHLLQAVRQQQLEHRLATHKHIVRSFGAIGSHIGVLLGRCSDVDHFVDL